MVTAEELLKISKTVPHSLEDITKSHDNLLPELQTKENVVSMCEFSTAYNISLINVSTYANQHQKTKNNQPADLMQIATKFNTLKTR